MSDFKNENGKVTEKYNLRMSAVDRVQGLQQRGLKASWHRGHRGFVVVWYQEEGK